MKFSIAARSLTGWVRKNNEDNYCINTTYLPEQHADSPLHSVTLSDSHVHLVGVFDGMGGHSDGETASYLTAVTASKFVAQLSFYSKISEKLVALCQTANETVCSAADGSRMGSTCALLCLNGTRYTICNVGDSPVFLLRNGTLQQLSVDHNQRTTYEQITGKPAAPNRKFKLTQCIGIPKEEMSIEPYISSGKLRNEDFFLICSDGITDMLSHDDIRDTIMRTSSAEKAAAALSEQALAAGGRDNITLICVKTENNSRIFSWIRHIRNNKKEERIANDT